MGFKLSKKKLSELIIEEVTSKEICYICSVFIPISQRPKDINQKTAICNKCKKEHEDIENQY